MYGLVESLVLYGIAELLNPDSRPCKHLVSDLQIDVEHQKSRFIYPISGPIVGLCFFRVKEHPNRERLQQRSDNKRSAFFFKLAEDSINERQKNDKLRDENGNSSWEKNLRGKLG